MPRRKSLLAQMYESRQKAKLQQKKLEEQAARAWAAEERRVAAQMEKEAAQERREAERAAQARFKEEQQAERTRQQEAARAERLAGVMEDKNAAKGVLVTTSWVGKASRDFAARNGSRIEIIEGRHLKSLLREHLGLDVLISLPKLPPGWERHEVS